MASERRGLQIINILDSNSPTIVDSVDTPSQAYGVFISGNHAFVADERSGVQVIDISSLPKIEAIVEEVTIEDKNVEEEDSKLWIILVVGGVVIVIVIVGAVILLKKKNEE